MAFNPILQLRPKARPSVSRTFTDEESGSEFTLTFRKLNTPETAISSERALGYIEEFVPDENGVAKSSFPPLPVPQGESQPVISEGYIYQLAQLVGMQPADAAERYELFDFAAMSVGLDPDVWDSVLKFAQEVSNAKKKPVSTTESTTSSSAEAV